eukprot:350320-Chlamydomonas_euryale.AAC.9
MWGRPCTPHPSNLTMTYKAVPGRMVRYVACKIVRCRSSQRVHPPPIHPRLPSPPPPHHLTCAIECVPIPFPHLPSAPSCRLSCAIERVPTSFQALPPPRPCRLTCAIERGSTAIELSKLSCIGSTPLLNLAFSTGIDNSLL